MPSDLRMRAKPLAALTFIDVFLPAHVLPRQGEPVKAGGSCRIRVMSSTPRKLELVTEIPARAMVVFAHPDPAGIGSATVLPTRSPPPCAAPHVSRPHRDTGGAAGAAGRSRTPDRRAERRAREQRAAADFMGVKHLVMLGYPDGELEDARPFLGDVVRALRRYRPDIVFVHDPFRTKGFQ